MSSGWMGLYVEDPFPMVFEEMKTFVDGFAEEVSGDGGGPVDGPKDDLKSKRRRSEILT